MKFNVLRFLKLVFWLLVIVLVLYSEQESAEAKKRNRKNRKGGKGLKKRGKSGQNRKHHQRRSNMKDKGLTESMRIQQSMIQAWQSDKSRPYRPPINNHPHYRVEKWREAIVFAHSKNDKSTILYETTARIGHHSVVGNVEGKLVHVLDPNMKTHFGCAEGIGNIKEVPRDRPWIAMIERGKCYFFNKIRMAKLHNASAVIIYNHKDEVEVMNTVGTSIMAMMISKSDERKISQLQKSEGGLELTITIRNGTHYDLPEIEKKIPTSVKPTDNNIERKNTSLGIELDLIITINNKTFFNSPVAMTTTSTIKPTSGTRHIKLSFIQLLIYLAVTYTALMTLHGK